MREETRDIRTRREPNGRAAATGTVHPGMRRHLCRLVGHKLPRRRRPFFFTERFQRCERCGERVKLRGR